MDVGESWLSVRLEVWCGGVETVRVWRGDSCWGPAVGTMGTCMGGSGRGTAGAVGGELDFGTRSEERKKPNILIMYYVWTKSG